MHHKYEGLQVTKVFTLVTQLWFIHNGVIGGFQCMVHYAGVCWVSHNFLYTIQEHCIWQLLSINYLSRWSLEFCIDFNGLELV